MKKIVVRQSSPLFPALAHQAGEAVPNHRQQRQARKVVDQEKDHRLGIIVEHEMAIEQQVESDASTVKCKCAIKPPEPASKTQTPRPQGQVLYVLAHHCQYHTPVNLQTIDGSEASPILFPCIS